MNTIWMYRAFLLAKKGLYTTTPNPRVGCIIIKNNQILGEGFTQPIGSDHAEIQALKDAKSNGYDVTGSVVYVTLEPCSHFGRTPPCVLALIKARISEIFIATKDPNPLVAGKGIEMLKNAGIKVVCGLFKRESYELNIGFMSRMIRRKPWIRMKSAISLDGHTALSSMESKWITCKSSRIDSHKWRARSCAILTGIGTIYHDNPKLNVRYINVDRQPQKIIIDSKLNIPINSQLFNDKKNNITIFCGLLDLNGNTRKKKLLDNGINIIEFPNNDGKVNLIKLPEFLCKNFEINELHVEAGFRLNGALLQENCVDELLIYMAPSLLGNDSIDMFNFPSPNNIKSCKKFIFHKIKKIGEDIRILARFKESSFLCN